MVGQSHFKTFDNKFFTFTGRCQYLLARDCTDSGFSVIIENVQVIDVFFKLQQFLNVLISLANYMTIVFLSLSCH